MIKEVDADRLEKIKVKKDKISLFYIMMKMDWLSNFAHKNSSQLSHQNLKYPQMSKKWSDIKMIL